MYCAHLFIFCPCCWWHCEYILAQLESLVCATIEQKYQSHYCISHKLHHMNIKHVQKKYINTLFIHIHVACTMAVNCLSWLYLYKIYKVIKNSWFFSKLVEMHNVTILLLFSEVRDMYNTRPQIYHAAKDGSHWDITNLVILW